MIIYQVNLNRHTHTHICNTIWIYWRNPSKAKRAASNQLLKSSEATFCFSRQLTGTRRGSPFWISTFGNHLRMTCMFRLVHAYCNKSRSLPYMMRESKHYTYSHTHTCIHTINSWVYQPCNKENIVQQILAFFFTQLCIQHLTNAIRHVDIVTLLVKSLYF